MATGGMIEYFGLTNWWQQTFTEDERNFIIQTYQPIGISVSILNHSSSAEMSGSENVSNRLTSGSIVSTSGTAVGLLSGLAGWFRAPETRSIAHRFLDKAFELANGDVDVLDLHFLYQRAIETYYKDRSQPEFMMKAVEACHAQIGIAGRAAHRFLEEHGNSRLPSHKGYEQLAIIFEKEKRWSDAIALCEQAQSEGWNGAWGWRIERCAKKLDNMQGLCADKA